MNERSITLGPDQWSKARELAERDGVSPSEVVNSAIDRLYESLRSNRGGSSAGPAKAQPGENAYEVALRAGLIGRLGSRDEGPTDLATNPKHMEGFGESTGGG